ncbi:hypothetical protein GIB67_016257, partial [Kingdonia uniflora]
MVLLLLIRTIVAVDHVVEAELDSQIVSRPIQTANIIWASRTISRSVKSFHELLMFELLML